MALRLPSYGYPETAENEAARFLGWMAGIRHLILMDPWSPPRPWMPGDYLVEQVLIGWVRMHYSDPAPGLILVPPARLRQSNE